MHFTGVLGTSAWAGVYVTQVCFYTNVHICELGIGNAPVLYLDTLSALLFIVLSAKGEFVILSQGAVCLCISFNYVVVLLYS